LKMMGALKDWISPQIIALKLYWDVVLNT